MDDQPIGPGDAIRYPTQSMKTRKMMRLLAWLLIPAVSLLTGCDEASTAIQQEIPSASTISTDRLPDWLQQGPEGWGEEDWLEYQASLIELRTPILRPDNYTADELQTVTAEVEHFPGNYEDMIKQEWLAKWKSQLASYELTGGCGCCNEVYTVTGPKAAMEEFPVHRGRRQYYPRYTSNENGG